MTDFGRHVRERLDALEAAALLRRPRLIDGAPGPTVRLDGRDVVLLCSNDYLGLAAHPELRQAVANGAARWGAGAGASRLVSGTLPPHREAERALAAFVGAEAALLFASGYAANVGTIQALAGPEDLVLSDALNHASLIDGCRLSRARVLVYRHRDVEHAVDLLRTYRHRARAALLVTDALFSMDGDLAPLAELRAVCDRFEAGLMVDEAHALGTTGPAGRGVCAACEVRPDVLVGTLGKALGLAGAFVAGSVDLVRLLENRARSYVFSTAPPPAIAAAVPTALALAAEEPRRACLHRHAATLRRALAALGLHVLPGDSPIVPILLGDPALTMRASARLLERGVFVQGIRPPTVPQGGSRLRVTPMATHEEMHLERALDAFAALAAEIT